jgi:uncharacterized protein (DUF2236 family)
MIHVAPTDTVIVIGQNEVEHQIALARMNAAEPVSGLFGPSSVIWRVEREAALFLGAGRALLLQLAHPWIAAAIADHSRTLQDPVGRFHRTFSIMFSIVFGTLDQAFGAARRLHRRHAQIAGTLSEDAGPFSRGSAYFANDLSTLRWVSATLTETALVAHDLVLPPLSVEARERYYMESKITAGLFGIPAPTLPPDWAALMAYNNTMWHSNILTVTPAARMIATHILCTRWPRVPAWYRSLTAQLMPARLRAEFGLRYGPVERASAEYALRCIRRVYPLLPKRLRFVGPYHEACARLSGKAGPGVVTRGLNRLWIGRTKLS